MFIETTWMRKGHGPGGIIGMTESPHTIATWVYSMDATMTLTDDLKCPMSVNVDRALEIGTQQLIQFEETWPEGFYNLLRK